jgi:hypothetical protein
MFNKKPITTPVPTTTPVPVTPVPITPVPVPITTPITPAPITGGSNPKLKQIGGDNLIRELKKFNKKYATLLL